MSPEPEMFDAVTLRADTRAWDRFVAAATAPSYLQASPWAAVKRPNGWSATRVVAETPNGPVGAQVLVRRPRPLPWGFGYAARGPLTQGSLDGPAIEAFTEGVRAAARDMQVAYVRADPELEDPDGSLARAFRAAGWRRAPQINPSTTRILDLSGSEDDVWQGIDRKWRQSISKGGRDGTRVVPAGAERLADFHAIHVRSMERAGIPFRTEQTYRDLWTAYAPSGHADLLFAEAPDGETLSTIFLVGWGPTTNDLYGGMTDAGAKRRANYLIKWEAIKRAQAAGYMRYDLWGLPSPPVAAFKAGWGGREVAWVGAWDLVLDPLGRRAFEGALRLHDRLGHWRHGRRAAG